MRTIIATIAVLAALFGATLLAQAKGPEQLRAEISGGGLREPIMVDGTVSMEAVFLNDNLAVSPPAAKEPAYTIKLTPADPTPEFQDFMLNLTYFPDRDGGPALLSGDWDPNRYFQAGHEFQARLENALGQRSPAAATAGDDGASALWYIAPSLAAVGLILAGGLAGRKLFFRHDE
ncbi:MAG TPA: hypothetical protein VLS25_01285 [Dehalococcoidia bacterium]|nr:hypothetical protein [Dehalococcoidia bacterium]